MLRLTDEQLAEIDERPGMFTRQYRGDGVDIMALLLAYVEDIPALLAELRQTRPVVETAIAWAKGVIFYDSDSEGRALHQAVNNLIA